ncbi:MAG: autotransporter-associated beta strand repeat-containing protein [Planctomycetia bacterium]
MDRRRNGNRFDGAANTRSRSAGAVSLAILLAAGLVVAQAKTASAQATVVGLSGTAYSQNFDGITTGQTSSIPTGWGFFRSGTSSSPPVFSSGSTSTAVSQNYGTAGTGAVSSSSSGGAVLWVSGTLASGTDKSIGFLSASSYPGPTAPAAPGQQLAVLFGFTNNTGGTITNLDVAWDFERYRQGSRTQSWNFYTSTDGSNWTANTSGDQTYSGTSTSVVYATPESTTKTISIPSLSIANFSSYYMRWSYVTTGSWSNAQGLGIDNFTMNATVAGGISNDLYWNGPGWTSTAPGSGGTGTWADGSGSWDSTKTANFAGTAGTVTAGAVTAARGLTFSTTGYTLSGGTITLSGSPSNQITTGTDNTVTATINSVLAGSGGLTKAGAGTLVLGGVNTFTGNLALNAGTVQVASDSAFGDAANDISLAGTLKTTAAISLGAGRDVTGGGTLDIAPGTTLTINGNANLGTTALANSGTLDLQGGTRAVGNLTFSTAATVTGIGGLSVAGITATGVTSGTAVVTPSITFSSNGNKSVDVGAGGTLVLNGDVAGTTGRIAKSGAGTLVVNGSNSTSGYQLGVSGAAPTNGGTLILGSAAASGTGQLQFNYGMLQATAPFTFANGLSVGGRSGAVAVVGGTSATTFSGSSSFYRAFGTSGELRLDVNNATTLSGVIGATSGSGTASGVTVGGTGRLTLSGNAAALIDTITLQDSVGLIVNNALGSSGVVLGAGNTLGGSGVITGGISGAGQILPGNSPGILTAASLDPSAGLDVTLEFTGFAPTYSNASASVNDVIRLTAATPFGSAFGLSSAIDIFLGVSSIASGNAFEGGFFTNTAADFTTSISGATTTIYVLGNGAGTDKFLGAQGYYTFANWNASFGDPALSMSLGTVARSADFGAGNVDGQVMVINAVPEPGAITLGGAGLILSGIALWNRRRQRRSAAA